MVQFLLSTLTLNSFTYSFHSEVCKCILVLTLANSYHICAVDLSQMLTRPNKAETAVRVCHNPGDMAVRMREVNKEINTYLIGSSLSGLFRVNWNLEMLFFEERGKAEHPGKNRLEQGGEPTTNSTHI